MTTAVGLRERKKARTREALQETALALFARRGFDHTTIEEIAEACEVSPRTFFRYYPTKEAVLFADAARRLERLVDVISSRAADEPPFEAVQAAMRELAVDYRRDRETLTARTKVVMESPQLQVYKAEHQHGWETEMVRVFERRAEANGVPYDHDALLLLAAVTTAGLRVALDSWLADARGPDLVVVLDRTFASLAAGFEPGAS